jgi:hypothetical protein
MVCQRISRNFSELVPLTILPKEANLQRQWCGEILEESEDRLFNLMVEKSMLGHGIS